MADEYIRCLKDPSLRYLKEVCETVFRKGAYRSWCKTCQIFQQGESSFETSESSV
jgi:hypothetical protein